VNLELISLEGFTDDVWLDVLRGSRKSKYPDSNCSLINQFQQDSKNCIFNITDFSMLKRFYIISEFVKCNFQFG